MNKTVKIIAIVLSVAIVGVGGYFGYTKWNTMKEDMDARIVAKEIEIAELQEELDKANEKLSTIQEVVSPTEDKPTEAKPKVSSTKEGKIRFKTGFPASFNPAHRVCFSNYNDISLQYCYWIRNSNDKKQYSNELKWNPSYGYEVKLPVGKYIVDFTVYTSDGADTQGASQNVYEVYALKECTYYADGEGKVDTLPYCGSAEQELKKYDYPLMSPRSMILNEKEHGGKMIIFEVKEGKTTTIKKFSLNPYLDLNR
ncbi:MAG TPA: hypothetical protein VJY47_03610 [Candidatus Dojkabacteria bacterium]|nr:hypothetical protein [Candidatus Dojkabacteria bacterium]